MNNFAVITKAEQDVAKAKAHLSVLKQNIADTKTKLDQAKSDYESNINTAPTDNSGIHDLILSVDLIKKKHPFCHLMIKLILPKKIQSMLQIYTLQQSRELSRWETNSIQSRKKPILLKTALIR